MNLTWATVATFGLLALAICALWLKPIQLSERRHIAPCWLAFLAAIAMGCYGGHITWQAVVGLAIFVFVAHTAATTTHSVLKPLARILTGLLVLALYLHKLPGFTDATLVQDLVVSDHAKPFTYRANFGAISTGLVLFAFFCNPIQSTTNWKVVLRRTFPIAAFTLAIVLGLGMMLGFVAFDWKVTAFTGVFLITNLLFTCVAEEAFFRGFMQEQLARALSAWRLGAYLAAFIGAVLFGVAHIRGGPALVLLATISGGCNAYAYLKTKRVESSILNHYVLNAVHFLAFTYPSL